MLSVYLCVCISTGEGLFFVFLFLMVTFFGEVAFCFSALLFYFIFLLFRVFSFFMNMNNYLKLLLILISTYIVFIYLQILYSVSCVNRNYDAEIYAFGKRLGEEFSAASLQRAFTHRYSKQYHVYSQITLIMQSLTGKRYSRYSLLPCTQAKKVYCIFKDQCCVVYRHSKKKKKKKKKDSIVCFWSFNDADKHCKK